jgi:hypothetical protein
LTAAKFKPIFSVSGFALPNIPNCLLKWHGLCTRGIGVYVRCSEWSEKFRGTTCFGAVFIAADVVARTADFFEIREVSSIFMSVMMMMR